MAYEDELATVMDEVMHLKHQLYGEKRRNRALERKISGCEDACVEVQVLHEELIKEKGAKKALKIEVAKKDAELDSLRNQVAQVEVELDSLRNQVAQVEAVVAKKDADIVNLQQEIGNKQCKKEALVKIASVLELKLKVLKGVRIYLKQDPGYVLTVRDGKVVVCQKDENDLHQYWCKDDEYGKGRTDRYGCIAFALVNIRSGQAMKPAIVEAIEVESCIPYKLSIETLESDVQLVPFDPNVYDQSILWSKGRDRADNYGAIKKFTNIDFNLYAFGGTEVREGNNVGLCKFHHGTNQLWKIAP